MENVANTNEGNGFRYFLRHIGTGKFFKAPDEWTEALASAREFPNWSDAMKMARQLGTEHLEMICTTHERRLLFGTRVDNPSPAPQPSASVPPKLSISKESDTA